MGIKYILVSVLFAVSMIADARPISYSGGSTLMMESSEIKDSYYYHYSPTYKFSLGIQQVKISILIRIIRT